MACNSPSTCVFSPNSFSSPSSSPTKTIPFPPKHQRIRKLFMPLRLAPSSSYESSPEEEDKSPTDPVKLAFSKSMAYRKSKEQKPAPESNPVADSAGVSKRGGGSVPPPSTEAPDPVKLAMAKDREYRKNKGAGADAGGNIAGNIGGSENMTGSISSDSRDGVPNIKVAKKEGSSVSSIDFLGLSFSDKKNDRRLPAGLAPISDPFSKGDLPEVEIIVGDASKFENAKSTRAVPDGDGNNSSLYKPKVSTWGVFPRPDNISKTYGGGRNICPGEVLETADVKAAKATRSRELIARYKNQIGLNIDAKTKSKCEKAMKDGDALMDSGKLREALPYYEEIMRTVVFESELHGLAALQWSICQDSLIRQDEARVMYEKLQWHPNVQVSKKARQFMFGFQAMEMMKISRSSSSLRTGYENYFEAFLEEKVNYTQNNEETNEDSLQQVLPYVLFLLSPIFIVLIVAGTKGYEF